MEKENVSIQQETCSTCTYCLCSGHKTCSMYIIYVYIYQKAKDGQFNSSRREIQKFPLFYIAQAN